MGVGTVSGRGCRPVPGPAVCYQKAWVLRPLPQDQVPSWSGVAGSQLGTSCWHAGGGSTNACGRMECTCEFGQQGPVQGEFPLPIALHSSARSEPSKSFLQPLSQNLGIKCAWYGYTLVSFSERHVNT